MKQKPGRRSFLKNVSVAGATAALLPTEIIAASPKSADVSSGLRNKSPQTQNSRKYNEAYTGEYLNRVAFPLGGMGAGMFCIEGTGAISHMSIRNKPDIFNTPKCLLRSL